LLIEWPEDEKAPTKYWFSTLPANIAFRQLVDIAKLRWRIERDYHELKQEVGLGHFEGRGWRGCVQRGVGLIISTMTMPMPRRTLDRKIIRCRVGATDVMHRAMRLLFERYHDWPGNVQPVLTVHDEILIEADIAFADQVGSLLAAVMVEGFRDVLPNGPTRFLAIPGVGPTWAAAKANCEMREKGTAEGFVVRSLTAAFPPPR
jgi:hypothetical protein